MPLCFATLTLIIKEKNLNYHLGTNYFFDKTELLPYFTQKKCYLTITEVHKKIRKFVCQYWQTCVEYKIGAHDAIYVSNYDAHKFSFDEK